MIRSFIFSLASGLLILTSCISHDVTFYGRTAINDDGSIFRSGRLEIRVSGEGDSDNDSLQASTFYTENFIALDEDRFDVYRVFEDGVMTVSWSAEFDPGEIPLGDYAHRIGDGPTAGNRITIARKNRWFYRDYSYLEIFSDPVDTARFYPLIEDKLSKASSKIMESKPMAGLKDRDGALALLQTIDTKAGIDIFRAFIADPEQLDSLSDEFDSHISVIADSLAGFAGVKLNPDSMNSLIKSTYDSVWDTFLTEHPGAFGSYGLDDSDTHQFSIEVVYPGCTVSTNADSAVENICFWTFDNRDFFAREFRIEVKSRVWAWGNVAITVAVLLIILAVVLWPVRRSRAAL